MSLNDQEPARPAKRTDAPSQYIVRSGAAADAEGIAAAHVASWKAAYHGLLPQTLLDGLSLQRRAAQWQRDLASSSYDIHVATDTEGHIGGFVATSPSRDEDALERTGELVAIYLRPQLWGKGLGSQLHRAGTEALARRFDAATLWVLEGNALARSFYERHGWNPDGTMKSATLFGTAEVVEVRYRRLLHG